MGTIAVRLILLGLPAKWVHQTPRYCIHATKRIKASTEVWFRDWKIR